MFLPEEGSGLGSPATKKQATANVLNFKKSFRDYVKLQMQTIRERPKSAPYLRLINIQGTFIGNIWKNFFSKKSIW